MTNSKKHLEGQIWGKVPPQAKELETAVLGAIMIERGAYETVSEILRPEFFYLDVNQKVFKAMQSLANKNIPIDMLTVIEELKGLELLDIVGGPYYVMQLTNAVVSSVNTESHCRIILQKFLQRELIRVGQEIVGDGYSEGEDVFDLLDAAETKVLAISNDFLSNDYTTIQKGLMESIKKIEHLRTVDEDLTGVPTGFPLLDGVTHGWQPTDLIIIAARPSVGKTAFALNLARNAAMSPIKPVNVGYFSLEMSLNQLTNRMLSACSGVQLEKIKRGKFDEDGMRHLYKNGVDPLGKAKIFIDDSASLNVFQLRSKARRMIKKDKVGLILIDYMQLMSGTEKNKNREQEISTISRELKKIAKELKVPVIALSQLSREVEKRGKGQKIPQLSDLRESGAIEQDADVVGFLYRPELEDQLQDADLKNAGNFSIKKHRDGSLEDFIFHVDNSVQTWTELGLLNGTKFQNQPNYPQQGGYRPITKEESGATMYIQKGLKTNDPLLEDDAPF